MLLSLSSSLAIIPVAQVFGSSTTPFCRTRVLLRISKMVSMICYNARNIFHRSSPGGIFSKVPSRWEIVAFASDKRKRLSQDKVLLTNRIIDLKLSLVSGNVSGNVELESRFQSLILSELGGYKTRSRVQWLEEGERLTRFFFRYSS